MRSLREGAQIEEDRGPKSEVGALTTPQSGRREGIRKGVRGRTNNMKTWCHESKIKSVLGEEKC